MGTNPNAVMGLAGLLPFVLIIVIFYFILIRPQMKKEKAMEKMRAELKKGDNVITSGGICATIADFKGNKVLLKSDGGAGFTVLREAITGLQEAAVAEVPPAAKIEK